MFSPKTIEDTPRALSLSTRDRLRLRAETLCDESTIDRWARGDAVKPATDARLVGAARKLKIQVPSRDGEGAR
jgi:hypothetical protein